MGVKSARAKIVSLDDTSTMYVSPHREPGRQPGRRPSEGLAFEFDETPGLAGSAESDGWTRET